VEVVDEQDHAGSGVGSSDPEWWSLPPDTQGDQAGLVDAVVADAGVGVRVAAARRPPLTEPPLTNGERDAGLGAPEPSATRQG
jgi:hypothetical protein